MGEGLLTRWIVGTLPALALVIALAGCSPPPASPSAAPTPSKGAGETLTPATPVVPVATPAAAGPGRPYDGPEVLALMRAQAFPAIDPLLLDDAIAAAIADNVWTYDGQPYREMRFEGTCEGTARCDLGVTGLPSFASDATFSDAYRWVLEPQATALRAEGGWPSLSGYPHELDPELEAESRALAGGLLDDLQLSSIRWVPDPEDRLFELQFDDGLDQSSVVYVLLNQTDQTLQQVSR